RQRVAVDARQSQAAVVLEAGVGQRALGGVAGGIPLQRVEPRTAQEDGLVVEARVGRRQGRALDLGEQDGVAGAVADVADPYLVGDVAVVVYGHVEDAGVGGVGLLGIGAGAEVAEVVGDAVAQVTGRGRVGGTDVDGHLHLAP